MSMVAHDETTAVARPLRVLVPLIKEDLKQGDEAAQQASMPYYRAAGAKMLEAKGQLAHGEFAAWVERNFNVKIRQAQTYMALADATSDTQKRTAADFTSLKDFRRRELGHDIPTSGGGLRQAAWQEPVKQIMGKVDVETLNLRKNELKRVDEREAERKLAMQLIDIGFKALASKLHPDKGGSRDAMSRLNRVRDRLKQHA
jgi:hypothetical protein